MGVIWERISRRTCSKKKKMMCPDLNFSNCSFWVVSGTFRPLIWDTFLLKWVIATLMLCSLVYSKLRTLTWCLPHDSALLLIPRTCSFKDNTSTSRYISSKTGACAETEKKNHICACVVPIRHLCQTSCFHCLCTWEINSPFQVLEPFFLTYVSVTSFLGWLSHWIQYLLIDDIFNVTVKHSCIFFFFSCICAHCRNKQYSVDTAFVLTRFAGWEKKASKG